MQKLLTKALFANPEIAPVDRLFAGTSLICPTLLLLLATTRLK